MEVKILFINIWTYNTQVLKNGKTKEKLSISYLDKEKYTHIHGELQIIIGDRIVPHLGMDSIDDVCIGYWIEMLTDLFNQINRGITSYSIQGGEQGKPEYKFDVEKGYIYLSIVDSPLGGKADLNWQNVKFRLVDFINAFNKFKKELLEEIYKNAPNMVNEWRAKFRLK